MSDVRALRFGLFAVALMGALAPCSPGQSQSVAPTPPSSPSFVVQPEAPLSPPVQAMIDSVRDAIVRARVRLARLPPATRDHDILLRLRDLDEATWKAVGQVDFAAIPLDQKTQAKDAIGALVAPVDQQNQDALLAILPPEGWFAISRYGADGEDAAYRVVLHGDIDLWRRFVPVVGRFAAVGEANGGHYALLSDRLAVHEGRPQAYGSQVTCTDGVYQPYPIDDPEHLDERRLKLGMTPYAVFEKTFAGARC